jgi:hypothetical protein
MTIFIEFFKVPKKINISPWLKTKPAPPPPAAEDPLGS